MKLQIIDNCIFLNLEDEQVELTLIEIFSIVHGNSTKLHGQKISREDFNLLGLSYRKYAAHPAIILNSVDSESGIEITCTLQYSSSSKADYLTCESCQNDYLIQDGEWIPLPQGTHQAAREFLANYNLTEFGAISLKQYLKIIQGTDSLFEIIDQTQVDLSAKNISERLEGAAPVTLNANLYPYQLSGYRWLLNMFENRLGSIIADEMGLGKTIQVICLFLEMQNNGSANILVVAPATILENWRREIVKFAPTLSTTVHRGPGRTGFYTDFENVDIVITSFETAVADISLFRKINWDLLVIDEAQGIKNPDAKRRRKLETLKREVTIAVTGTPLENTLTDLWSITDFVLPGLLGTQAEFERDYPDSVSAAQQIEPVVTPIMLRRLVKDVADDLPEKIYIPHPLLMEGEMADIYEHIRSAEAEKSRAGYAGLVKLRMYCTHPWVVDQYTSADSAISCSPKLARLMEIVEEIIEDGNKALIFTAFTEGIDLIAREIDSAFSIPVGIIDGRLPVDDRQPLVDDFSSVKGSAVLVMNPKAAGTGLNITAANHVIHYNLEWNPAIEDQASARAFRRGQMQTVMIHRMFYIDTVEDVINDRMDRKRHLAEAAIVGTEGKSMETEDLLRAFSISPMRKR